MFQDRIDVGEQLARSLHDYKGKADTVVVALPRGGVVPAEIVANALDLPMEVVMVKKIGHPTNPEYAIGAVSLKHEVLDDTAGIDAPYLQAEIAKVRSLLEQRYYKYYGDRTPPDFKGKTVIIVDDGVATGRTVIAAIRLLKEAEAATIVVAVPVGPSDTITELSKLADKVICLEIQDPFYAISQFYREFGQVSDDEVIKIIEKNK